MGTLVGMVVGLFAGGMAVVGGVAAGGKYSVAKGATQPYMWLGLAVATGMGAGLGWFGQGS